MANTKRKPPVQLALPFDQNAIAVKALRTLATADPDYHDDANWHRGVAIGALKEMGIPLRDKPRRYPEEIACYVHADQQHGKEAHELREGVEQILEDSEGDQAPDDGMIRHALRKLLDEVDARDSLAYVERTKR